MECYQEIIILKICLAYIVLLATTLLSKGSEWKFIPKAILSFVELNGDKNNLLQL